MKNVIWSVWRVIRRKFLFFIYPFAPDYYMRKYTKYLRKCGMNIANYNERGFIHPTVWFDSNMRYSLICIGEAVTISKDAILLTHDYTIRNAINAFEENEENIKYRFLKPIEIGQNVFIGTRAIILPGTIIGDNCIIGAGAVVKGVIPDGTVWGGSPARQLCATETFYLRHKQALDYTVE